MSEILKQQIAEAREKRKKATAPKQQWVACYDFSDVPDAIYLKQKKNPTKVMQFDFVPVNDFEFIAFAANNIERILTQLEIAVKSLEEINKKVPELVSVNEAADMACEFKIGARQALEEMEKA